jgi:hypothetical protein
MSKKQNDRATHVDVIEVHEALKSLIDIIETGPDGKGVLCRYKGNDDDHTVAQRLKVSAATVSSIRRQRYGNLRAAPEPDAAGAEIAALKATIEQQAGEIAKLHAAIKVQASATDVLVDRFNRLLDSLAMNRAIDAKHLKVKQGQLPLNGAGHA